MERAQRVVLRICLGVPRTDSSRHTLVEPGTNTVQNAATERAMRNFILMEETLSTGSLVKRIATRRAHFVTLVNLLEERVWCLALQTVLPPHSKLPTLQVQLNITKRGPKRETPVTAA